MHALLEPAYQVAQEEVLARHLIGAHLHLRATDLGFEVKSASVESENRGRTWDFLVNDMGFHVATTLTQALSDRCQSDLDAGVRPFLLVPEDCLAAAYEFTEANGLAERIEMSAMEWFVADSIAFQSSFQKDRFVQGFLRLLDEYNRRVDIAETDKSLLIEIPANLQRLRQETPGA